MASHKKVTAWSLIGSLWTAWWCFITIWVVIADWPNDAMLWELPHAGNAWFLWELLGIWLAWFGGIAVLWVSQIVEGVNAFMKMMKGFP